MKRGLKIAIWVAIFVFMGATGVIVARSYFVVGEPQMEESILSFAETLREQRGELERLGKQKKEASQDRKFFETNMKREAEIKLAMQRTVAAYREKLREELQRFHELETRIQQLSQNDAERRLRQEQIDALRQNQVNILFWLNRSVQTAPHCYCVPSDVQLFLSGR